jgi:phenylalanyl-tRNA synthetase beta chain
MEDLKGVLEGLLRRIGIGDIRYGAIEARPGVEHPFRTAAVLTMGAAGKTMLGHVFEVDPRLTTAYDIRAEHVQFALLNFSALHDAAPGKPPEVREIDHLPAVERDLAVIVKRDVHAEDVAAVIRANAGSYLRRLDLFDRYQGAPLEPDEVSLAYRLRFQPMDAPMSESDIDSAVRAVTDALARDVQGRIRSGS